MYLCVCKAVSEKQVRRAIREGQCSLRMLEDHLGVGSGCGRCVADARTLIDQAGQEVIPLAALSGGSAALVTI